MLPARFAGVGAGGIDLRSVEVWCLVLLVGVFCARMCW